MIRAIILTFIILVVIYIFLFRSTRKRKKEDFDTVAEYRSAYIEKNPLNTYKSAFESQNKCREKSYSAYSADSGSSNTNKYVTKYNSDEDYREK